MDGMGDVNGAHEVSVSPPKVEANGMILGGKAGESHHNNHKASISCSVTSELDVITQGGVAVPCSALAPGTLEGNEDLIRGSGDAVGSTALCPDKVSTLDNAGSQSFHILCSSSGPATTCHAPVAAVPMQIASNRCPSVREAEEQPSVSEAQGQRSILGLGYDRPVVGSCSSFPTVPLPVGFKANDGGTSRTGTSSISSPVVPPLCAPKVEVIEGLGAVGPFLQPPEIPQRVAQFVHASVGEDSDSMTWVQAPQGRGKAVVRRGRPRLWPADNNREATRKRVRIDELYGDASPSVELTVCMQPDLHRCVLTPVFVNLFI